MPFAHRAEIIPPTGVEFAVHLQLSVSSSIASTSSSDSRLLGNLVVARSSLLRVFEVRQQLATLKSNASNPLNSYGVRKGTEAVAGEVEMDAQGDGFVNVAEVKALSKNEKEARPTETRLFLLREHRLHGTITGLEKVQTVASVEDGLDRLIVSFKDAKIALMEWSEAVHDLATISIHTYERAPQLMSFDSATFRSFLRVDPISRCAALALPRDAVAILPLYQSQAELENLDQETGVIRDAPYSPSFILDFPQEVDPRICNIVDFIFLPGFNTVTLALLYQTKQTWAGRLNEFKDTVSLSIITLDFVAHSYPHITRVDGLPYDCSKLLACPASYGGVIIQSPNALIHVDQASRITPLAVNAWASRVSSTTPGYEPDEARTTPSGGIIDIEGAQLAFIDEINMLLVLSDGVVHVVTVLVDGRTVNRLKLSDAIALCSPPSMLRPVTDNHLFVGSTAGPSTLLRLSWVRQATVALEAPPPEQAVMDEDLDEDLYGDATYLAEVTTNGEVAGKTHGSDPSTLRLTLCDTLHAWGSILGMTMSANFDADRPTPELVACTASKMFTRFQAHLPTKTKRKIQALSGNRGIWSLPIRREMKIRGARLEQSPSSLQEDTIIVSSHAVPTPGMSRIFCKTPAGNPLVLSMTTGLTLVAGTFFQRTSILQILPNAIRLLNGDGQEKQIIAENDVVAASVSDPFILVQRKDGSIALYAGDTAKGTIKRAEQFSTGSCICSTIYTDHDGAWEVNGVRSVSSTKAGQTGSIESVLSGSRSTQWLALLRSNGSFEIRTLPSLDIVHISQHLHSLPAVLSDSRDSDTEMAGPTADATVDAEVDKFVLAPFGRSLSAPHLIILTKSNLLVIYQSIPQTSSTVGSDHPILKTNFVKVFTTTIASPSHISRQLVPFRTIYSKDVEYRGVFCTGARPFWLISTPTSPIRLYYSSHAVVYGFTSTSLFRARGDFIAHTEEGPTLEEWTPNIQFGAELPYKTVQAERAYTHVAFDTESQNLIAGSYLQRDFATFDEEGNPVWTPEERGLSFPQCGACSVEVISPSTWETIAGYELPQYEELTMLACLPLESSSTESGFKNFVIAATSLDRGEDLAARGAVYIFEIVEVVSESKSSRNFELRLRCRDESKGPVTALCGLNGYLVSSMGQKIYVRAFDLEERLVGVAFLDVGVHVTSLRTLKNMLLIGDVLQGTWFVVFQEDPFKLSIVAKGRQPTAVSNADFFFNADQRLSFLVSDEEGVLRIFDFDHTHADSSNGQRLLCRTEFHGQCDHRSVITIARRNEDEDDQLSDGSNLSAQSILLYGTLEGSVVSVSAVSDAVFKRLSLLQGQLVRNVQHTAGLNPRAYRTVRNDTVSRPLTRGILDGGLLSIFGSLEVERQMEMTKQIGTERRVVLRDLATFTGVSW